MDIYSILSKFPHNEHYLKRYIKFIDRVKLTNSQKFITETHHIIPNALTKEFKCLKDNPWNKAILTARCHFIAHWMLYKAFDNDKLILAFSAMNNQKSQCRKMIKKVTGKVFQNLKTRSAIAISKANSGKKFSTEINAKKGRSGSENGMYGVHRFGEQAPRWNKPHTKESKQKLSDKAKNRQRVECPHCGKICDVSNAKRHHFDMCKYNPLLDIELYNSIKMLGRVCRIFDKKEMDRGNYAIWVKNHNLDDNK